LFLRLRNLKNSGLESLKPVSHCLLLLLLILFQDQRAVISSEMAATALIRQVVIDFICLAIGNVSLEMFILE
jgi:hypothetical protein